MGESRRGLVARALAAADRVDDGLARRRGEPPGWQRATAPGPVARGWAATKLLAVAVSAPIGGPIVGALAARNTVVTKRLAARYAGVVDDVLAGRDLPEAWTTARVDAGDRWFVASDLHRYVRGTFDWPGGQDTKDLYATVLNHYADHDHGLIEAGDVEDFWLTGGSTYGAAYDVLRLGGLVRRSAAGRRWLSAVHGEHLRRVVANNPDIYRVIQDRFLATGRYLRLIGNHDDAFADPAVVEVLQETLPGTIVHDFVVFERDGEGIGVVTHGHHTDSWNGPGMSGLGRLGTWLASTIADAPLVGRELGVPDASITTGLLRGEHRSVLTPVSAIFGANLELYSVDEVLLFASFQRAWGEAGADLDGGPYVLLGHTHLPLAWPVDPGSGRAWKRYVNAGSGVTRGLVTGVEWDGATGPEPDVRLVGWHWADPATLAELGLDAPPPDAIVAEHHGRPIARQVFGRVPPALALSLGVPAAPVSDRPDLDLRP